jgi:hypothetical protein
MRNGGGNHETTGFAYGPRGSRLRCRQPLAARSIVPPEPCDALCVHASAGRAVSEFRCHRARRRRSTRSRGGLKTRRELPENRPRGARSVRFRGFIARVMNGDAIVPHAEDVDATTPTYAEVKATASSNPLVIEKASVRCRSHPPEPAEAAAPRQPVSAPLPHQVFRRERRNLPARKSPR